MRRALLAGIIAFTATLGALAQASAPAAPERPEIVVTGHGTIKVRPDRASLHVLVETRARAAAEAGADNARRLRAVLDTLARLGFGEREVATVGYPIQPDMRYVTAVVLGRWGIQTTRAVTWLGSLLAAA